MMLGPYIENVRILGPLRHKNQIEISKLYNIFSYHNTAWAGLSDKYEQKYITQAAEYNYELAMNSEDEFPQLVAEMDEW